jgi:menaquinone-dependent protoporphyrinogen IX oxidase
MKILVTYKSKTGFTKWYAEIVAKEVAGDLVDFSEVTVDKMSEYDVIVYGGGLHAGKINGFNKAKEMFNKSSAQKLMVFVTGATPNAEKEVIDVVWKNNLLEEEKTSIPHFYMQSGLCYEKMSFGDRAIMKLLANALSKKKNKSSSELGQEEAIKNSYDISDKKYAEPLIKCLLEGCN